MAELIQSSVRELKAVLKETERSANKIMSSAEAVQKEIEKIADKKLASKIGKSLTRIFENSNFQDITGQRINKVIKNLEEIKTNKGNTHSTKVKTFEESLMEGPQLKSAKQADIDKLFEGF